jgi:hypothetical protein
MQIIEVSFSFLRSGERGPWVFQLKKHDATAGHKLAQPSQTLDDESFPPDKFFKKIKRVVPFKAAIHEYGKETEQ